MPTSFTYRQIIISRFITLCLAILSLPALSFSQGKWSTLSSDGYTGRYGSACAEVDGKIYVIGGQTKSPSETTGIVEMYDPKTDTWESITVNGTITPRRNIGTAVLNGKIYLLGGDLTPANLPPYENSDVVEVFDPKTRSCTALTTTGLQKPLRTSRTVVYNNKIYAFGGLDNDYAITPVVVFDPSTNKWTEPTTTGNYTLRNGPVALVGNKVYVLGGASINGATSTFYYNVDVFDLSTNTWSNVKTSGYFCARTGGTTQVINGKIHLMAGTDGHFVNDYEIFDPATNTWNAPATTGRLTPRNGPGSALIDGNIYVIGGADKGNWNAVEVLDPTYVDPSSLYGTWTTGSSKGFTKRASFTASAVNGKIYVIGGYDSTDYINPIEVYDPATDSWSTLTTTGTYVPRNYHTANVINGKIYIIGGWDSSGIASHVDVFDPSTNSWSTPTTTGDFYPRANHTASVVNGKIYVIGGVDDVGYIDVVDEFDPATNTWLSLSTTGTFIGRHALTSCAYKDKIYVHGGFQSGPRIWANWIDVFDPENKSLSDGQITGQFIQNCFVSSGLLDGKMYIMGGNTPDGLSRITRAYDIETTQARPVITTGTFTPRNSTGCDTLNGKIYLLGGYFLDANTPEAILNTVEIFTPSPVNAVKNSKQISATSVISPNPASSFFTVSGVQSDIRSITVLDLLGKALITTKLTDEQTTVDVSALPIGAYYVKIEKSASSEMQMLIKK